MNTRTSRIELLAASVGGAALDVLRLIRPSQIAAIAIIVVVPALLANYRGVFFRAINVPSYIGPYERHADIRYGDLPRQSLDVYVPRGASSRPTVVFWYGGFWRFGEKEWYRFVGAALANAGYVAIVPDYRVFPEARFPQFVDDGALAVKWAHEHASQFGGDPRSIFLMGHSAGGHIAELVALDERYLANVGGDSSWIRGWIAVSAPHEIRWMNGFVLPVFGGRPVTEWRPILHVSARAPPALLIHGLEDSRIHPREAVDIGEQLRAVGVPTECRIYGNSGHMAPVLAMSPMLRFEADTLADVEEFIARTVAGNARSNPDSGSPCPSVRGRKSWERPLPQPYLWEIPPEAASPGEALLSAQ